MTELQDRLDEVDRMIRTHSLPAHLAKTIQAGLDAQAAHEAQKRRLEAERAEIAAAMKQQVTLGTYEKRKAERAAEEAQVAQAQQELREAAAQYNDAFDDLVVNLRRAAEAAARCLVTMDEVGKLSASLTPNGRRVDAANTLQLQNDLSLLIGASFKAGMPAQFRHRFGILTWSGASDARFAPNADWAGEELQRMARQVIEPLAGKD